MLKEYIKASLQRMNLYHKVKFSFLYDVYWSLMNPGVIADRDKEVKFYRQTLKGMRKGDLVFDIGANFGYKSDIFLRLGASVIAAEADSFCLKILQQRFKKKSVTVIGKAISYKQGRENLFVEKPGSAKNTLSKKWKDVLEDQNISRFKEIHNFTSIIPVDTTTVENLIEEYGVPYFVKIDVEGYECNVLKGLRSKVPFISFELNLPEFLNEGMQCISLLKDIYAEAKFNYIIEDCGIGFKLEEWVGYEEFSGLLQKYSDRYMEVFCRMTEE